MMYLNPENLRNQSTPAPGLLELTSEQEALYTRYNGFVRVTSTDPVEIEADTAAWESWKAGHAGDTIPPPTELEQLRADVDFIAAMTGVTL